MTARRSHCCSFCDASADDVFMMIAGKRASICSECVGAAVRVLAERALQLDARQQEAAP